MDEKYCNTHGQILPCAKCRDLSADDFDAYLEHVASLQDSTEHKRYLAGSLKCFQEWCDNENERRGSAESERAWPQAENE